MGGVLIYKCLIRFNIKFKVVTHTNYTYEEMVAFVEAASQGDPDEEKKIIKQIKLLPLFFVQLIAMYWYLMPAEKCFFRRERLSWAEKQIIMESAKMLENEIKTQKFISPDFVDPEKFTIKPIDVKDLKKKLFHETMNREFKMSTFFMSDPMKEKVIPET